MTATDEFALPGQPESAPTPLALVQDFANAHFLEEPEPGRERRPEPILGWLKRHGLPAPPRLAAKEREAMLAFRRALRSLIEANDGSPHDADALRALNELAPRAPLVVSFEHGAPHLRAAGVGINAAIAHLLAIVTATTADRTFSRLKICRADDCRWAFYDRSKNRSGSWCSMSDCGNRAKARAFRARRRAAPRA